MKVALPPTLSLVIDDVGGANPIIIRDAWHITIFEFENAGSNFRKWDLKLNLRK